MKKLNQSGIVAAGLVVAVVGLVTFGSLFGIDERNDTRGRGDAPVGAVNNDPKDVYQMPDRFSNVAVFCDKWGNAVYSTTKSDQSRAIFALKDGCQ